MKIKQIIAIVLLIGIMSLLSGASWYVDKVNGLNTNDGTQGAPWQELDYLFTSGKITAYQSTHSPYNGINRSVKNPSGVIKGGDTIFLMSGTYSRVFINRYWNDTLITIRAYPGQTPIIQSMEVASSSNWKFSNIHVTKSPLYTFEHPPLFYILTNDWWGPTRDVYVDSCKIYCDTVEPSSNTLTMSQWNALIVANGFYTARTKKVWLTNSEVRNTIFAIKNDMADSTYIMNNIIRDYSYDGVQTEGNYTTIQGNVINNGYKTNPLSHDDGIQGWSRGTTGTVGTGTQKGLRLIGNTILAKTSGLPNWPTEVQGIGLFDGFYEDFIISNNLVVSTLTHGISIYGAREGVISNNTVVYGGIMVVPHKNGQLSSNVVIANNIAPAYSYNTVQNVTFVSNKVVTGAENSAYYTDPSTDNYTLKTGLPEWYSGIKKYSSDYDMYGITRSYEQVSLGAYQILLGVAPPAIVEHPADTTINEYSYLTLYAVAGGSPLKYIWQDSTKTTGWTNKAGSTSSTYRKLFTRSDSAFYRCIVYNELDTVISNPAKVSVNLVPVITVNPRDTLVKENNSVTFSITAINATSYKWLKDGVVVTGATSNVFTSTATLSDNKKSIRAIAINAQGIDTSDAALLTVRPEIVPMNAFIRTFYGTIPLDCVACTSNYTIPNIGTPKAAILLTSDNTTERGMISFGMTNGVKQVVNALYLPNLASPGRTIDTNKIAFLWNASNPINAYSMGFVNNGIRIIWNTRYHHVSRKFTIIFFCGDSVSADLRYIPMNSGAQNIGFSPNLLFSSTISANDYVSTNQLFGLLSLGIATQNKQMSNMFYMPHGASLPLSTMLNTTKFSGATGASALTWSTTLTISDTGYYLSPVTGQDTLRVVSILALKLGKSKTFLDTIQTPTTTGLWDITKSGFKPDFGLLNFTGATSNSYTTPYKGPFGISTFDDMVTSTNALSVNRTTATSTSENSSVTSNDITVPNINFLTLFKGNVYDTTSNSLVLNMSTVDPLSSRHWMYLAVQDDSITSITSVSPLKTWRDSSITFSVINLPDSSASVGANINSLPLTLRKWSNGQVQGVVPTNAPRGLYWPILNYGVVTDTASTRVRLMVPQIISGGN